MIQQPFEKIFKIEKCVPGARDVEMSLEEIRLLNIWLMRWVEGNPDHPIVKNLKIMYTYDDLLSFYTDAAMTGIVYAGDVLHRRSWDKKNEPL